MKASILRGLAVAVALTASTFAAQAQDWAAIAPNTENTAPVVRAATRELARERAVAACRRISSTCTDSAAFTSNLDNLFALVCCAQPRRACVAAPGSNKADAVRSALDVLEKGNFSQCQTTAFYSARTGQSLALTDTTLPPPGQQKRDNRDNRDNRDIQPRNNLSQDQGGDTPTMPGQQE